MSRQYQQSRSFHGQGGGGRGRGGNFRHPNGGNFSNPAQGPGLLPTPLNFTRPPYYPGNQGPVNQNYQDYVMPPRDAYHTSSQQSLNNLDGSGRGGPNRGRGNRGNYRGRRMSRGSSMSDLSGDSCHCNQGEARSHDQAQAFPRNQSQSKQNDGGLKPNGRNRNKNMQNDDSQKNQSDGSNNRNNGRTNQPYNRSYSPDSVSRGRGNQSRRGSGSRGGRGQTNTSVDNGRDRHPRERERIGTDYPSRQAGPHQPEFRPTYRPQHYPRGSHPGNFQRGGYGPAPTGMPGPHRFSRPPNPDFFHTNTIPPEGLETFFRDQNSAHASQNEYGYGNRRESQRGCTFGSERRFRGGSRVSSRGGGRRSRRGRSGYPVYKQEAKEKQETDSDASDVTEISDTTAGKDHVHVPDTNARKNRKNRGRPKHRRGGWSMYANRYNKHVKDEKTSNVDSDDYLSICETVSVRSSSPMSVTSEILEDRHIDNETKREKINADDIKDRSATTLNNRVKRYQKKIITLKCLETVDQAELQHIKEVINKIKEELAHRRQKLKKKEMDNQKAVTKNAEIIESKDDIAATAAAAAADDDDDKASGNNTAKSNMPLRKMHTKVVSKKGGVSFRPMSKMALKQAKTKSISGATGKRKSSIEEQTVLTAESDNEKSKETVDDQHMPRMESSAADNQVKEKRRKRNRRNVKKEEQGEENDEQLKELERLLDGLDVKKESSIQTHVKDKMDDTGNLPKSKSVNSTPANGTQRGKQDIHAREKTLVDTARGRQGKGARAKTPVDTARVTQGKGAREETPVDTARGRQGKGAREKTPVDTARGRQNKDASEKAQEDTAKLKQGMHAREKKTPVDTERGWQGMHAREKTPVDITRGRQGNDARERRDSGSQLNQLNVNEVFKFMVKEMDGRGSVEDIVSKSGLFPQDCDRSMQEKWFKSNSSRFTLLWRDGKLQYVYVLKRECKTCLDYSSRGCSKTECKFYHVCKDYLSGFCRYTANKCRFSHDLFDEYNLNLLKEMGYNRVFNTTEILSVLRARFPQVCAAWNKGSCYDDACVKLHLCKRYVLDECLEGDDCMFSHDRLSNHNKPIVDAYQIGHWNEGLFRKMIIVEKEAPQEVKQTVLEEQRAARPKVKPSSRANRVFDPSYNIPRERRYSAEFETAEQVIQQEKVETVASDTFEEVSHRWQHDAQGVDLEDIHMSDRLEEGSFPRTQMQMEGVAETGILDNTTICDLDLVGKCSHQGCSSYHNNSTKVPYLWQVKLFGSWVTIADAEEKIERPYCTKKSQSEEVLVMIQHLLGSVVIEFQDPKLFCRFSLEDTVESVQVRRISTISYTQSNNSTDNTDSFKTQWRWYWQDDSSTWQLYEDTMQYTLETKYVAGQKKYMFSRENYRFKYVIDFENMTQLNLDTFKTRRMIRRPILVKAASVLRGILPEKLRPFPPIEVPLPKGWFPWDHTNEFELVELSAQSRIYREVAWKFFMTVSQSREEINCIYRVQSHSHWNSFCNKEKHMTATLERTNPGSVLDKRELFHGTDNLDTVRGICTHNFDQRVSGKNATVYGDGAYFARDAKYSHSYTKAPDRFVFLARVLVGQYTTGRREYRRPPLLPGSKLDLYDSCVDNIDNPSIFILFDKSQHYPAYLIQYKDKLTDKYTEDWVNNPSTSRNTSAHTARVATTSTHATHSPLYTYHRQSSPPRVSKQSTSPTSPSSPTYGASNIPRQKLPSPKKDSSCCVQ